jgi:hypothetical protein
LAGKRKKKLRVSEGEAEPSGRRKATVGLAFHAAAVDLDVDRWGQSGHVVANEYS